MYPIERRHVYDSYRLTIIFKTGNIVAFEIWPLYEGFSEGCGDHSEDFRNFVYFGRNQKCDNPNLYIYELVLNKYNCIFENVIRSRSSDGSAFVISRELFYKAFL